MGTIALNASACIFIAVSIFLATRRTNAMIWYLIWLLSGAANIILLLTVASK